MKRRVYLGALGVGLDGEVIEIELKYKARVTEGLPGLNWLWIIGLFVRMVMNVSSEVTSTPAIRITAFRMRRRIIW